MTETNAKALKDWFSIATETLSKASKRQVRSEMLDRYSFARESAIYDGAAAEAADAAFIESLGDPLKANEEYRQRFAIDATVPDASRSLDLWLATATRHLAPDCAAQVRAEITEHYRSAVNSGAAPEAAIASLGDARRANRQYRRVLLTDFEAFVAIRNEQRPQIDHEQSQASRVQPQWGWFLIDAVGFLWAVCLQSPWLLWLWGLGLAQDAARYCFPPTTPLRKRLDLAATVLRNACIAWLWYTYGDSLLFVVQVIVIAIIAITAIFPLEGQDDRIRRKLAGRPASVVVPESATPANSAIAANSAIPASLTPAEANFLRKLQQKPKYPAWPYVLSFGLVGGLFLIVFRHETNPAARHFGGVVLAATAAVLLTHVLSLRVAALQTPDRGRRFRYFKWTVMAIAAVAPPICWWTSGLPSDYTNGWPFFSGVGDIILFAAVFGEYKRISIRRKLPAEEWPKELYT